ncbi:hypothetical protein N5C18_09890 [Stenotrophomonas sp. GD03930]|uniref:fimbrial protein n=1 Tax=Stenotrophomonas sp. GD03930 TaxID=2975406 RepID=UPI00244AC0AF|nr:fimbrial protein [Stenotrophomonas sp. GD03930]MDH1231902.1 hypothetical protein [Stenotrophomonas sp. GD03930]HEL4298375.1 hypothetical protein [Stenotrophomonas maltophilia]
MTTLPVCPRSQRSSLRDGSICVALGLLLSASAAACTSQHNSGTAIHLKIDAWDDVEQDKLIANWTWAGNARFLLECATGAVVPLDVTATMPGLNFVRNVTVDGRTYAAFGLSGRPRSPLLIFRHETWTSNSGEAQVSTPLDVRVPTHIASKPFNNPDRGSIVLVAAVSRGGVMEPFPATLLGPISRVSPLYPHLAKTDTFTVTANLKVPTCTLSDTPVSLVDVAVADLPASGRFAGERTFDVAMNCNRAIPIELVLTDANLPGNTGSLLTPTANSTAGAVRVELLREGKPVELGKTWTIPLTQDGSQNIPLAARYYREPGTFHGGVVEGQAIITATYR